MGKNVKRGLSIFILVSSLFLISCTSTRKETEIVTVPVECDNDCDKFIEINQGLTAKYNDLVKKYNLLMEERDFWKNEDLEKAQLIELCKDKQISVPRYRTLYKKTFCKYGCDYKLYCTGSMIPFFDCNDEIEIYENVRKEDIEVCDIIAFKTPEHKGPNPSEPYWVIHQVIKINSSGYQTKGVANVHPDNYIVQFEDIKGKLIGVSYN